MKIYTKILIGMVAGALIGLFLGPKSSFLEKDRYKANTKSVKLLLDKNDPSSRLKLPTAKQRAKVDGITLEGKERGFEIDLAVKSTEFVDKVDKKDKTHKVASMVEVEFEASKQIAILDGKNNNALAKLYGKEKLRVGDKLTAWLVLDHIDLDSGGFVVSPQPVSSVGDTVVSVIHPVGLLFMKLIKMVIVPLVFASLVVGVASLGDIRKLGRLGGKTLGLYLCTTAMAVTIGLTVAHVVSPGSFVAEADKAALTSQFSGGAADKAEAAASAPSAIENVLAIIPDNPIRSMADGDMLPIIFFAVIFAIALTLLKEERSKSVVVLIDTIQHAMIMIIHMVMAVAPYGVAALLAKVVGESGLSVLGALLVYALTVILGLLILATVVYGGLVKFLAKVPWLTFMKSARPAQLIAFSTSSSSAALPITMECAEENLGVSNSVTSFVIPLGSTVNMDGTALYQGVAAVFIAQVFGVDLSFGDQIAIVAAATMASIGAAGVPGAGMITLAMVLTASGIPTVGVALILGVDRLLDMFRSAVNVTGDLAVTTVMAVAEGEKLSPLTSAEDAKDPSRGFERRLDKEEHAVAPDDDPEPEA